MWIAIGGRTSAPPPLIYLHLNGKRRSYRRFTEFGDSNAKKQ